MVSWPICCTASLGNEDAGSAFQGERQAGKHAGHQLVSSDRARAHLEGAALALADGKYFRQEQCPLPVYRRHAHPGRLVQPDIVPEAVVDFTLHLEEIGVVDGQQRLARLGQVAHCRGAGRHHRRGRGPDDGIAVHGGGFLDLGLGRRHGRLG